MRKFFVSALAAGFVFGAAALSSSPAWAQQAPAASATKAGKAKAEPTPIDTLRDYTISLIDGMDESQLRYIYEIRLRHGYQRATQVVRRDVGAAVDQCARAHPAMKADMTGAYDAWKQAVDPLMKDSQAALKKTVSDQKFVAAEKIDRLLGLVDKAGEYTEKQNPKTIITTEEACTKLLNSMSDTRENIARLLRESLTSIPVPPAASTVPEEKEEKKAE